MSFPYHVWLDDFGLLSICPFVENPTICHPCLEWVFWLRSILLVLSPCYLSFLMKLDQVYCAWLIKWVLKREIIQLAELCLSRWWIKSGTWWYWISIWRYSLVLGQYKLELLGFRWYRVSKGLECLYILEKVEIWSGDTDAWHTDWQTSEYSATQLVSSIKHKLSHAISKIFCYLTLCNKVLISLE